jgi:hypothetical protein
MAAVRWLSRPAVRDDRTSAPGGALAEALAPGSPARWPRRGPAHGSGPTRREGAVRPLCVGEHGALRRDARGMAPPLATALAGGAGGFSRRARSSGCGPLRRRLAAQASPAAAWRRGLVVGGPARLGRQRRRPGPPPPLVCPGPPPRCAAGASIAPTARPGAAAATLNGGCAAGQRVPRGQHGRTSPAASSPLACGSVNDRSVGAASPTSRGASVAKGAP